MKIKERGITLIALVVTIIVLLILAGVSIAMITGQSGILGQAGESSEKTGRANVIEDAQRDLLDEMINSQEEIEEEMLRNVLNKHFIGVPDKLPEDLSTLTLTSKDGKYKDILASEVYKGTFEKTQTEEIFEYDINDDGTATITGIKEDYQGKYYVEYKPGLKDENGNYYVEPDGVLKFPDSIDGYTVTCIDISYIIFNRIDAIIFPRSCTEVKSRCTFCGLSWIGFENADVDVSNLDISAMNDWETKGATLALKFAGTSEQWETKEFKYERCKNSFTNFIFNWDGSY